MSQTDMEIKINIPKNDYVQPTEVREEVVQLICDWMLKGKTLEFNNNRGNKLYVVKYSTGVVTISDTISDNVCVHGVEVQAAFDALHKAGYYIYGWFCITDGKHTYGCSKTPYHKGYECNITKFDLFID